MVSEPVAGWATGLSGPAALADAEVAEDHVEHGRDVDAPGEPLERPRRDADLLGDQLLAAFAAMRLIEFQRASERGRCGLQHLAMAFARHQNSLGRKEPPRECA